MTARIVTGKASGEGRREPTLRDVMRALEKLRVEVHQRMDEMAAELVKLRSSIDDADEHQTKDVGLAIVKRGALGAAKELRRAAAHGDKVRVKELADAERQAIRWVLPSGMDVSAARLDAAARELELKHVDAQQPRKRHSPTAFASRERRDSSGRKHTGPYGRGRRRR